MKHVGVVSNSYNSNVAVQLRETESALRKFNVQKRIVEARAPEELEPAINAAVAEMFALYPTRDRK